MAGRTSRASGALLGRADIPGDKSISHRALLLGALAEGETKIANLNPGEDVKRTAEALRALGIDVMLEGDTAIVRGGEWTSPAEPIDCGNSGTTARLLIGALAGKDGLAVSLTGDSSLTSRPMRRVTAPLERMGATFEPANRLPLTVKAAKLGGIDHENVPASAQVKTGILLAGLHCRAPVSVREPMPSRDHSEIMLHQMGCEIDVAVTDDGGRVIRLGENRSLAGRSIEISGDSSAAAFPLLGAAIVAGSKVSVGGLNVNPTRTGFYETLEQMGAVVGLSNERLVSGEIVADVEIAYAALSPCEIASERIPAMIDEVPALAVACAFADGESVIHGLGELKHKESDRLGALVTGLNSCGVTTVPDGDALRIFGRGRVAGGSTIVAHGDHRIAMAFLTLGLASDAPVGIDDDSMIPTSFPGFLDTMRAIGGDIQ